MNGMPSECNGIFVYAIPRHIASVLFSSHFEISVWNQLRLVNQSDGATTSTEYTTDSSWKCHPLITALCTHCSLLTVWKTRIERDVEIESDYNTPIAWHIYPARNVRPSVSILKHIFCNFCRSTTATTRTEDDEKQINFFEICRRQKRT